MLDADHGSGLEMELRRLTGVELMQRRITGSADGVENCTARLLGVVVVALLLTWAGPTGGFSGVALAEVMVELEMLITLLKPCAGVVDTRRLVDVSGRVSIGSRSDGDMSGVSSPPPCRSRKCSSVSQPPPTRTITCRSRSSCKCF